MSMPQRKPIDRRAASFASTAERQLAQLRKSLTAAEDSIAGLRGSVKVPVPKGGRRSTRGVRSNPNIFERAGISGIGNFPVVALPMKLASAPAASTQELSANVRPIWSDMLQQGQRIMRMQSLT